MRTSSDRDLGGQSLKLFNAQFRATCRQYTISQTAKDIYQLELFRSGQGDQQNFLMGYITLIGPYVRQPTLHGPEKDKKVERWLVRCFFQTLAG